MENPAANIRVLFVDRDYTEEGHLDERAIKMQREIAHLMSEDFGLEKMFGLSERVALRIQERIREGKKFGALVTHVPYNDVDDGYRRIGGSLYYLKRYAISLDILSNIRRMNPQLIIVAYTGADIEVSECSRIFKENGVDAMVGKTLDPDRDYGYIKMHLDDFAAKRQENIGKI